MRRWGTQPASLAIRVGLGLALRRASPAVALALLGALVGLGCKSPGVSAAEAEAAGAVAVSIGEWQKDHLHCASERCDNFYWIDVTRSGDLRVEVYAPWGAGLPDFGVVLLDQMGKPIAAPKEPNERPARLSSRVSPGRYTIRVHAMGSNDSRIGYELIANFEAAKPAGRSAAKSSAETKKAPSKPAERSQTTRKAKASAPTPVATPVVSGSARRKLVATAEVLDVEQEGGEPVYVLLDAGEPQKVRVGMHGRLHEGEATIGEIEIIEVYRDGSRAKLLGALGGEITIDTAAEIFDAR
ncbi:MAG: hypothetical protein JRH16_22820 [Deltaproteobacteria bacterium]|nr:hypothetical protein [Deltaproteobacteria bacterium]